LECGGSSPLFRPPCPPFLPALRDNHVPALVPAFLATRQFHEATVPPLECGGSTPLFRPPCPPSLRALRFSAPSVISTFRLSLPLFRPFLVTHHSPARRLPGGSLITFFPICVRLSNLCKPENALQNTPNSVTFRPFWPPYLAKIDPNRDASPVCSVLCPPQTATTGGWPNLARRCHSEGVVCPRNLLFLLFPHKHFPRASRDACSALTDDEASHSSAAEPPNPNLRIHLQAVANLAPDCIDSFRLMRRLS